MSRTRMILAGSRALAVDAARALHAHPDFELAAVIPCPRDDVEEKAFPSLTRAAKSLGVPLLGGPDRAPTLDEVAAHSPDIVLSIFYGRILREPMISLPRLGTLNLHFGILPQYRGNRPINWAMINGDPPGFTIHYIDAGIDSGDVIHQQTVLPRPHDTAHDVYERATRDGLDALLRILPLVAERKAPRRAQDLSKGTYWLKGHPFDREMDWTQSAVALERYVRAYWFPPFPAAILRLRGVEHEIAPSARVLDGRGEPGEVLRVDGGIEIATGRGSLEIAETVRDGARRPAGDVARSLGIAPGDRVEGKPWRYEAWQK